MALLKEEDREYLIKEFGDKIKSPVKIVFFGNGNCQHCELTEQIVEEISSLHDKISLEKYPMESDKGKEYGIERIPAIVIEGEKDYGIRFYGIPAGYEFNSLIESIMDIGRREVDLSDKTKEKIKGITVPVIIKVFVTTSCPYCPNAVRLAHKLAFENENIKGEMIEANSFPELSARYGVYAVPKVVINEKVEFEGALPEDMFVKKLMNAVGL